MKRIKLTRRIGETLERIHKGLIPEGADYGQIHPNEAEFLLHRVLDERPKCVVEIGTAAGVSTSYILSALEMGDIAAKVTAVECLKHCYFDPSREPGFILDEAFPVKPNNVRFCTGVSSQQMETLFEKEEIDFIFIDGNHTHPWAALDTIFALPFLAPGALVMYHDINLHHRGGENKKDHVGPHYVFYNLPAVEKLVVGEFPYPNIGSLRITTSQEDSLTNLMDIMFRFEWRPGAWPAIDKAMLVKVENFISRYWGEQWGSSFAERVEVVFTSR